METLLGILPSPRPIRRCRQIWGKLKFYQVSSEIGQVQFFEYPDVVLGSFQLCVSADDDIVLKFDTSSFLDLLQDLLPSIRPILQIGQETLS